MKALESIKRGVASLETEAELKERLRQGRPLRVKLGADPSAPDIHLGHTVVLNKLRLFQDLGHEVVFIIGDFTARIGDPSGRSKARPPLTKGEVERNAATYQKQIFKILDSRKTTVVMNSRWLDQLNFAEVIRLASQTTVAQLLQRDDFAGRYSSQTPISLHEFLYPLAQAYDSVKVKADVEIGGTDQTFNLLLTREIQKAYGQPPQVIITMPILEGLGGREKMSKSLGNYVGVTEPPFEIFGKIMSISDELMPRYYELLTEFDYRRLASELKHPKLLKLKLAEEIVGRYHGRYAARRAKENFELVHAKGAVPPDSQWVTTYTVEAGRHWLPQLMKSSGLARSTSEARRLICQGAVEIDGRTVRDDQHFLEFDREEGRGVVIKAGKKKFAKIEMSARNED